MKLNKHAKSASLRKFSAELLQQKLRHELIFPFKILPYVIPQFAF